MIVAIRQYYDFLFDRLGRRVGDRVLVKVSDDVQYYVQIRAIHKGSDDDSLPIHSF